MLLKSPECEGIVGHVAIIGKPTFFDMGYSGELNNLVSEVTIYIVCGLPRFEKYHAVSLGLSFQ